MSILLTSLSLLGQLYASATFSLLSPVPYFYSDFKTITTEHFNIHYPSKSSKDFFIAENMEKIAQKTAIYAEEAFEKLTEDLNSKPYLRVQVVIIDNTDSHNAFASPIPQNTIYIYATPPLSHTTIAEYDNWLRETIMHEMTHIINLSTTRGYSAGLRAIFGTIVNVNGLWPLNLIEGLAVFEETNMTKNGRGRSTFLHTMLRTSAYENTLNSKNLYNLSRSPYITDEWPLGLPPYLYGYLLFEHTATEYGMDIPGKISKHNPGVVPYWPSYSFKNFTGKEINELWEDTLEKKRRFYSIWISYISKGKVTEIEEIRGEGYVSRAPSLSPDGKFMAYYNSSPDHKNRILIVNTKTKKEVYKIYSTNTSTIEWIDNNRIIFNSLTKKTGSKYYELMIFNLEKKQAVVLKNSSRILYSYPTSDKTLCTVRTKTGISELNIEEIADNKIQTKKTIYTSDLLGRISKPFCRIKGTGYEIFFIDKEANKNERILRIDTNNKISTLYESRGSIKDFTISGNKLTFIDNRDGIFNLYKMDLGSRKTVKISNLISGAFELEEINSIDFYITYYTSYGFKIGRIQTIENKTKNKFALNNLPIKEQDRFEIKPDIAKGSYWAFKSLLPKLWIPTFIFVENGFTVGGMTYGADSLFRHQYFISGAYDSRTKKPLLSLSYTNQQFYPIISFSATSDNIWYGGDNVIEDFISDIKTVVPINDSWSVLAGISYHYRMLDFISRRTKRFGIFGGVSYRDTSTTTAAISVPEKGISGFLRYSLYPKRMGSSYSEYEIDSTIRLYQPLWKHHVIAINNNIAYTYGNPYMFFITGGEYSSLILGRKKFLMRGYPVSYFGTNSLIILNIEYRFPIVRINRGRGLFPLFIRKIHGALISDNGFMGKSFKQNFHSYGFELRTDADVIYHLPVTLRLGLYKGTRYKKGQFFVGVSSIF